MKTSAKARNTKSSAKARAIPAADTVRHHASETLRVASERTREFADLGVQRAKEGFEQLTKTAQGATENARKNVSAASLTVLDAAKEDADAAYEFARDMINAQCPTDAFNIQAKYLKGRLDKRVAQSQELAAYFSKMANDAVTPFRDGVEKLVGQFRLAP